MNEFQGFTNSLEGLYALILGKADKLHGKLLDNLLKQHELNCISRTIKQRFPQDSRNYNQIKELIKKEYGLN